MKKPEKKYCYTCGSLRTPVKAYGGYDEKTGKRFIYYKYVCPNKKFWSLSHEEEDCYWRV